MNDVFIEITITLGLATALGLIARQLRQPTILGYLTAGLIVGPLGLLRLDNEHVLDAMAQIGITLLLFLVGLDMRFNEFRKLGRTVIFTGIGQIVFTSLFGYLFARVLGFALVPALYVAVALTFSSTIIVVKLLAEKNVLDSLYGRIVVGFLLVQDFVAIIALIILAGLSTAGGGTAVAVIVTVIKGALLFIGAIVVGKYVVSRLLHLIGQSQEMLFLTSLAWGLGLAALVTLPPIGFSIEIGGFLAGIAMADSVQHLQISSRIKSLRDFFIVMFFVVLGSRMVFGDIGSVWVPTAVLSLFVLIGNPLIVMAIMGALGFRSRTAFLSSVTVAQISEFSMILAALGHRLGHIDGTTVALVTAVGIITITLSSYMIIYDEAIYKALRPMLKVFEFRPIRQEESVQSHGVANHMVLIGCHRMGQNILASLEELHKEFVVVDFNPDIVAGLKAKGIRTVYGDVSDPDIQDACGLTRARAVISTVPNFDDSLAVLEAVKSGAGKAKVILTAETELEAERLYKAGADYVLLPHFIGGLQLAQTIRDDKNLRTLTGMRRQDLGIIGKHL